MLNKVKLLAMNKEFYWTLLFQFATLFGGVLLMKLLAVSLSKNEYGFYAIITSVAAFVLMMPFTGLLQGVSRYISIYQEKNQGENFLKSVFIITAIGIAIYTLLGFVIFTFYPLNADWNNIFIVVFVFTVTEILKVTFRTINNAFRYRKNIAISVFIEFFFKVAFIFLVYSISTIDIEDVLLILIVANIMSIVFMYKEHKNNMGLVRNTKKHFKIHFLRIWIFSYPLLIWAVFGWLRDMSNRWYLDYFLDKEHVALFAMMSSIALIAPVALQGVVGSFFIPIIYQQENSQKGFAYKFLAIMLPSLAIIFFIGFIIVFFIKDFIVVLVSDEKYLSASWMLPWMFLAYSLYVLSMISTYQLFAHNQTKRLILSSVVPGIIAFGGGYILIGNYGVNGALYNYILTYSSYALLTFLAVFKYSKSQV